MSKKERSKMAVRIARAIWKDRTPKERSAIALKAWRTRAKAEKVAGRNKKAS